MRGLDTNVVVRFVMRDHERQIRQADAVFEKAVVSGDRLFVKAIVLCEIDWVLSSAYREPRERIATVLAALLETPEVVVEDADVARRALAAYAAGPGDFADYFFARRNERLGCETTLTFDKSLRRAEGVTLL